MTSWRCRPTSQLPVMSQCRSKKCACGGGWTQGLLSGIGKQFLTRRRFETYVYLIRMIAKIETTKRNKTAASIFPTSLVTVILQKRIPHPLGQFQFPAVLPPIRNFPIYERWVHAYILNIRSHFRPNSTKNSAKKKKNQLPRRHVSVRLSLCLLFPRLLFMAGFSLKIIRND